MSRLDYFPKEEIIRDYRIVFGGSAGERVLAHMLFDLGLFDSDPTTGEEGFALKNYAARLLAIIGGGDVEFEALGQLIAKLRLQPLPKKAEE